MGQAQALKPAIKQAEADLDAAAYAKYPTLDEAAGGRPPR